MEEGSQGIILAYLIKSTTNRCYLSNCATLASSNTNFAVIPVPQRKFKWTTKFESISKCGHESWYWKELCEFKALSKPKLNTWTWTWQSAQTTADLSRSRSRSNERLLTRARQSRYNYKNFLEKFKRRNLTTIALKLNL